MEPFDELEAALSQLWQDIIRDLVYLKQNTDYLREHLLKRF